MTKDFIATREAIVQTAAEMFCRGGFGSGTTREIAAQVGLSQPALYYYIGSKDEILARLASRLEEDLTAILEKAQQESGEPFEQLRALIRAMTRAVVDHPALFALYWAEPSTLPERISSSVEAYELRLVQEVGDLVSRAQGNGHLMAGPPRLVARALLGMVLWTHRWSPDGDSISADEVGAVFLSLLGLDRDPGGR